MDLASLKKAMEAALAASQADASNKDLQKAYAEAKKAYDDAVVAKAEADKKAAGGDENDDEDDEVDEEELDEKTKAYLAKLRKENAGHRTKNKELVSKLNVSESQKKKILEAAGIEVDTETPEEKLKSISAESQQLAFRTAILESAVEHGIGKDSLEFYEFLVAKAVEALEEGEELSDEAMEEIISKVKKAGGKGGANTSVGTGADGKGGKNPPDPNKKVGEVTLEKFIRMSITEKSKLYETNLDLYTELTAQARAQRKLV